MVSLPDLSLDKMNTVLGYAASEQSKFPLRMSQNQGSNHSRKCRDLNPFWALCLELVTSRGRKFFVAELKPIC